MYSGPPPPLFQLTSASWLSPTSMDSPAAPLELIEEYGVGCGAVVGVRVCRTCHPHGDFELRSGGLRRVGLPIDRSCAEAGRVLERFLLDATLSFVVKKESKMPHSM